VHGTPGLPAAGWIPGYAGELTAAAFEGEQANLLDPSGRPLYQQVGAYLDGNSIIVPYKDLHAAGRAISGASPVIPEGVAEPAQVQRLDGTLVAAFLTRQTGAARSSTKISSRDDVCRPKFKAASAPVAEAARDARLKNKAKRLNVGVEDPVQSMYLSISADGVKVFSFDLPEQMGEE